MEKPMYPINASAFNREKQQFIGAEILAYLHGIKEDDEINGADLVDLVMRAIYSASRGK